MNAMRSKELNRDFHKILNVLAECPQIERGLAVPAEEFAASPGGYLAGIGTG